MRTVPQAGRIFLSLWLIFAFYADPLLEISTVRYLYLARAVAENSSFAVDSFAHRSRGDLAVHNGHLYSGSPPGLGLALVPLAVIQSAWVEALPFSPNQSLQFLALWFFQAPLAALALLLLWQLLLDLGYAPLRAAGVTLALGLATPYFFFVAKLSDYPLVSFLMVILARIGLAWRRGDAGAGPALLAGLTLGLAWTLNDLAALLAAVFLLLSGASGTLRPWPRRALFLALGLVPGLVARGLYSASCFGSPLANPLAFSAAGITVADEYAALGSPGDVLAAIILQFPELAWDLTLGDVGIFVFAPVALLLWGWTGARRRLGYPSPEGATDARGEQAAPVADRHGLARAGLLVFALNAALHLLLVNGLWTGGASWGPRYLLFSAVPLALAGAWAAGAWSSRTCGLVTGISGLITWAGVQYGYSTSVFLSLGHLVLGGPTTPGFRWLWLHWAWPPTPERAALVWQETPRLGAYYALTHPSPFLAHVILLGLLLLIWRPQLSRLTISFR